jgi:hypothetical protein
MERPLHAGGVAIEPSLEVVESCAHDRVAVSHLRFLLSHASTIAVPSRRELYGDRGGERVRRIGEAVGHTDLMTTARTYTHVLADEEELDYEGLLAD